MLLLPTRERLNMERELLTSDDIRVNFADCPKVSDLIMQLERKYSRQGFVISKLTINGLSFTEDDEEKFGSTSTEQVREVSLDLTPIHFLLHDTEISTIHFANNLVEPTLNVADQLRSEALEDAHNNFKTLVESYESLFTATKLIYEVKSQQKMPAPSNWLDLEKQFAYVIKEVLVAYEKRDYILTADLLEYEITKLFGDLISIIEADIERERSRPTELR